MKHVILTPNPYRDKGFQTVRRAVEILENAGVETKLCLPFDVDRSFELPKDLRFHRLDRELSRTDGVVCFGGDGTILHMAKAATRKKRKIYWVYVTRLRRFTRIWKKKRKSRLKNRFSAIGAHR